MGRLAKAIVSIETHCKRNACVVAVVVVIGDVEDPLCNIIRRDIRIKRRRRFNIRASGRVCVYLREPDQRIMTPCIGTSGCSLGAVPCEPFGIDSPAYPVFFEDIDDCPRGDVVRVVIGNRQVPRHRANVIRLRRMRKTAEIFVVDSEGQERRKVGVEDDVGFVFVFHPDLDETVEF